MSGITSSGPTRVNVTKIDGVALDTHDAGSMPSDVRTWNGSAVAAPATAGVPKVAIEAAGDFAQGAADKVWSSATRILTGSVTVSTVRASSTQRGTITLQGVASNTAAISSVTTTRATAHYDGGESQDTAAADFETRITLTNATTITASRNGTGNGIQITNFSVPEFL